MYKRLFRCLLYADNNDVENVSRMCMVLPIRNFYRCVDYGKKIKMREIELYSQCIMRREIFIYRNVYQNWSRNVEKYERAVYPLLFKYVLIGIVTGIISLNFHFHKIIKIILFEMILVKISFLHHDKEKSPKLYWSTILKYDCTFYNFFY